MSQTHATPSRGGRVLGLSFLALFVLLCGLGLTIQLSWNRKPTHWTQEQDRVAALSSLQRQAVSTSLRNRLLKQWSDPGKKTPVTEADLFGHREAITIPYNDLNTWLKAEGLSLLEEIGVRVPDSASTAMIDSPGDGLLRISFEVTVDGVKQILALSFAVTIAQDGTLTSTLRQATAGRLPLPVAAAIDLIASQAKSGILLDLMRGNPIPPIELPIDASEDGLRNGRLVGLKVNAKAMTVTRKTVRRDRAHQAPLCE